MNKKKPAAATSAQVVQARGARTQAELAALLGVSRTTIQNWENGRSPITRAAWVALLALVAATA